jgi:ComF family protein
MSNLPGRISIRLPKFWAAGLALPGQDCSLCGGPSRDELVCGSCERALPHLEASCAQCAVPLAFAGICGECQRRAPYFDDALAAFEYRFPLDRLVQRFKYSGDLALGRWLALRVCERARAHSRPDLLVAVPLTRVRLRERGFNQAMQIAHVVGRELGVPRRVAGLARVRDTEPQPGLRRRERRANLRHAFRCDLALAGEHVAVIDDVMTTGATAEAVAQVLKQAGAGRVSVWVVARTPDPRVG